MGKRINFKGEDEFIWTMNGIAREVGLSTSCLKRFLKRQDIQLSKTRNRVYISKYMIPVLKRIYIRSKVSRAQPKVLKPRPPKQHKIQINGEDYVVMKCSDVKKS